MTVGRFRVKQLLLVTEFRVRLINHNHNHTHDHSHSHNQNHNQGAAVTLGGEILGELADGPFGRFSEHKTA